MSKWSNEILPQNISPEVKISGPVGVEELNTESDFIFKIWDDEILSHIIQNFNNYQPKKKIKRESLFQ